MKVTRQLVCSFVVAAKWSAAKRTRIREPGLGFRIG
jgi:hypothetical protein